MEHADVIREIDTLIDSYNWEGLVDEPDEVTASIKRALRAVGGTVYFWKATQHAQFALFELFLQILRHPGVVSKGWVLESLCYVSYVTFDDRSEAIGIQRYRALQNAVPLLRQYMKHRKASYRLYAVLTLSRLTYQPNQVVSWLLDYLNHECSFQTVSEIFDRLGGLFSNRHGQLISSETRRRVIGYLESLLKSKHLTLRIQAATLLIRIMQAKTPPHVTDSLVASWSKLDAHNTSHRAVLRHLIEWLNRLGPQKRLEMLIALLLNSKHIIAALELWDWVADDYFHDFRGERLIAFSYDQKALLDAVLTCKPLWRTHRSSVQRWGHGMDYHFQLDRVGLEETRAGLHDQLKQARILPEAELAYYSDVSLNLISYPYIDD